MKAFVVEAPHHFGIADVPVPAPADNEVLLRVGGCGICGSDLDILDGTRPLEVTRYPLISGHEFSGQVVETGRSVTGFRDGDRVAVDTILRCDHCHNCRLGWTAHCLNGFRQLGCTDPGGLAEFVSVPQRLLYRLPEELALSDAAIAEPTSCAAHGVTKAQIRPGDSVAIVGAGTIGALAIQIARLFSPGRLMAIEVDPTKLEIARRLGASHVIDGRGSDVAGSILEITKGAGADAVIECTGAVAPIQETVRYVGTKGRIVVIGVPPRFRFEIDYLPLLMRDAVLHASNGYTTQIWLWVLQLLARGFLDTKTIITHRLPLNDVERGIEILRNRSECAFKVMTVGNS